MSVFETYDDIVPGFKFLVEIPNFGSVNFQAVEGLSMTHETQKVRPGGKYASQELYLGTTHGDVTLKRGLSKSSQLWDFANHPLLVMKELGDAAPDSGAISISQYRQNITIKQLDMTGTVVKQWRLTDAWVKSYSIGNLDSLRNELSIESIVLSHSGLILEDVSIIDALTSRFTT